MTPAPPFDCAACGRRIGKRGGHNRTEDDRVICSRCLLNPRRHRSRPRTLADQGRIMIAPRRMKYRPLDPEAMRAWVDLDAAARAHRDPVCATDPELWFSARSEDREVAAEACGSCPLAPRCHAYAELAGERFGVWAGVDREPTREGAA